MLISMESGARGNPYPTSIAEDEGVMLQLLRRRRDAGSCRVGADCNEWNPCCSKHGYCGTRESGHCTTPESDWACTGLCWAYGWSSPIRGGTNPGVVHTEDRRQNRWWE